MDLLARSQIRIDASLIEGQIVGREFVISGRSTLAAA
jgi:hypothetical protein